MWMVRALILLAYANQMLPVAHKTALHTVKKAFDIPVPGRDVTYQSLPGGNNDAIYKLFPPWESLVSHIPAGDGNIKKLFFTVHWYERLAWSPVTNR
jgi:hypothetical protein